MVDPFKMKVIEYRYNYEELEEHMFVKDDKDYVPVLSNLVEVYGIELFKEMFPHLVVESEAGDFINWKEFYREENNAKRQFIFTQTMSNYAVHINIW